MILFGWGVGVFGGNIFADYLADRLPALRVALAVIQQHRLVTIAPASAPVLLGLNSSAIYLGVAMGGGFGGLAQDWLPVTVLGLPAAVLALLATIITIAQSTAPRATTHLVFCLVTCSMSSKSWS